ncbi:response regulator [Litoribrevibacter albus]|uniref:Two-component system response regulator n=1 Tax=Litoribrevibacter albus TaxID=1473156 RepID=A0AA37S8Q2_9GAMM|nr:two-component system response regulator [Litoribrevibacter albus]GLQ30429.1 two-component system response regulator [Litoribrevibacter albus]
MNQIDCSPKILLVDDEPNNLQVLKQVLDGQYHLMFAKNGQRAIELALERSPHLILLDVMMPEMDGFEVCRRLKSMPKTEHIPIIFVTAMSEVESEFKGFEVGAVDYITKPISPAIVRARVKTHLSLVRVSELVDTQLQIVRRLGRASEYKDNETGLHVIRMSHYSVELGRAYGLNEATLDLLLNAAPMHDVGKIGIPDNILLKPGKLTDEEWEIMKQHPQIGADIVGDHGSPLLDMAKEIALTHHEKWDGSGYPKGLKGEEIPLVGRIVAIADVFDALTTERPYKKAWSVEEALKYLTESAGTHFDPTLIDLFVERLPAIIEIMTRWKETPSKEDVPEKQPATQTES